jgi:hypothetical protein
MEDAIRVNDELNDSKPEMKGFFLPRILEQHLRKRWESQRNEIGKVLYLTRIV